jgi:hypothetical protein
MMEQQTVFACLMLGVCFLTVLDYAGKPGKNRFSLRRFFHDGSSAEPPLIIDSQSSFATARGAL